MFFLFLFTFLLFLFALGLFPLQQVFHLLPTVKFFFRVPIYGFSCFSSFFNVLNLFVSSSSHHFAFLCLFQLRQTCVVSSIIMFVVSFPNLFIFCFPTKKSIDFPICFATFGDTWFWPNLVWPNMVSPPGTKDLRFCSCES